jgi:hypothetical protein
MVLAIIGALRIVELIIAILKYLIWNFIYPKKKALWNEADKKEWEEASVFGLLKSYMGAYWQDTENGSR